MGTSKQLLDINGTTMLADAATKALAAGTKYAVVVLGAKEAEHRRALKHLSIECVANHLWIRGMGSSLKVGLAYLLKKDPTLDAVVVMVCDQPLITSKHVRALVSKHEVLQNKVVTSWYAGTMGVPTLFSKNLFEEILRLPDDHGARQVIKNHVEETTTVDFGDGAIDLDTPGDYKAFVG
jgi:molybdenum cofactor cytidylyltransferase